MVKFTVGSIFDSEAEALVNTVNCEGFMGKGLAYQFKKNYPLANKDYVAMCRRGELRPGIMHWYKEKGKIIIDFPTKDHWRLRSEMLYIEKGLEALLLLQEKLQFKSIALPPLGAGNGGLPWSEVRKLILGKLKKMAQTVDIVIFEPSQEINSNVNAPRLGTRAYLLMSIIQKLASEEFIKVENAAFFVNLFFGSDYFMFKRVSKSMGEGTVGDILKNIEKYRMHYNYKNIGIAMEKLKLQIVSDKFNHDVLKIKKSINSACLLIKRFENDKEVILARKICEKIIDCKSEGISQDSLIDCLKRDFAENICVKVIETLTNEDLLEKNLFGISLGCKENVDFTKGYFVAEGNVDYNQGQKLAVRD